MPEIFIDGRAIEAREDQTVIQAARAAGIEIPHFCWHPSLSVPGNCRMCLVEVEGRGTDIACNMPVKAGMKVLTGSDEVRAQRKAILQFITLNHPVDCGVCDKAGECTLQDYHYEYNGAPSTSIDAKVQSTKFYELSKRIVLDNERCIVCSRCVRFTREISMSNALGVEHRGDTTLVRPAEDCSFDDDPYSDNVIDLCPVGALLSRDFMYRSRVWYLQATPSVCPGCERGCTIQVWHRKPEWRLKSVNTATNDRIMRITPLENPAVNGPWICNKGRDMAQVLERPRALEPRVGGAAVEPAAAVDVARRMIGDAGNAVALVSSWGSNEELEVFQRLLADRFRVFAKPDQSAVAGERLQDDLLIRPDKNPNGRRARELFGTAAPVLDDGVDLLLVWGEGLDPAQVPARARLIYLSAWNDALCERADVLLPISLQTERAGHYTNFQGVISAFQPCFDRPLGVSDAADLFEQLGAGPGAGA